MSLAVDLFSSAAAEYEDEGDEEVDQHGEVLLFKGGRDEGVRGLWLSGAAIE